MLRDFNLVKLLYFLDGQMQIFIGSTINGEGEALIFA